MWFALAYEFLFCAFILFKGRRRLKGKFVEHKFNCVCKSIIFDEIFVLLHELSVNFKHFDVIWVNGFDFE